MKLRNRKLNENEEGKINSEVNQEDKETHHMEESPSKETSEQTHLNENQEEDTSDISLHYQLKYDFSDISIINDIYELICISEKSMSKFDKEKIDTFFKHFIQPFFLLTECKSK